MSVREMVVRKITEREDRLNDQKTPLVFFL